MNQNNNEATLKHAFDWYATHTIQEIFDALKISDQGLTTAEAKKRNSQYGLNKITTHEIKWWNILFNQIKSPFIYLLIIIAGINFILQDPSSGLIILLLVLFNILFGFFQEFRTYHALQILKKYIVKNIRVIRDNTEIEIPTEQLTLGDIVIVYPGNKIPADIRFLQAENLAIDESILTGESTPIQKNSSDLPQKKITLYDAHNIGFSGTTVINGKAKGIVYAIGNKSYFGSITSLAQESPKLTSFMLGIQKFSRFILYVVFVTITCVFFAHLILNPQHFNFINLIIFSTALGISIIPEALPVVISFSLARGALRLARHKMVVKRLSAIEDLGSVQILCIDKTGTLTESKLAVSDIYAKDERETILYGILASGLSPKQLDKDESFNGPLWRTLSDNDKQVIEQYRILTEHPFEPERRYSSIVVQKNNTNEIIVRGNKEEIFQLCTIDTKTADDLYTWAEAEGKKGHRVLAIAKKGANKEITHITEEDEKNLDLIGLISYEDPIKKTVQAALEKSQKLGITIKIISGDAKEVNYAVAQRLKLIQNENEIITGEEFAQKNDQEKKNIVESCTVFAHIIPEQKVEIIKLLEENYDVGYLGDGINDAPALKAAHVSIAVNTAADLTRDMADIILLRKSLQIIVDGIYEGRIIFSNLIKYIKSTLAANFGHFYSLSIISLFIDYLPILPSQLLLISLLTDLPLISISTDTVDADEINKPKTYNLKDILMITMLMGTLIMITDFLIFRLFYQNVDHAILQTNWFIANILIELCFFYSIRTKKLFFKSSLPSWQVALFSLVIALVGILLPFTDFGHVLLNFKTPSIHDLAIIVLVVSCSFIIMDLVKVIFYRLYNSEN